MIEIIEGDVFDVLPILPRRHYDSVVTSPPYWLLRSYLDSTSPDKARELGSEPTPAEYVARMVQVMRLVRECLADHGTVWLNLGDTYASTGGHTAAGESSQRKGRSNVEAQLDSNPGVPEGLREGSLCLIPQRLMIALSDDGWLVRSVVVWRKPSAMPASLFGWQWQRCRVKASGQTKKLSAKGHGRIGDGNGRPSNMQPDDRAEWADCPGCKKCKPNGGLILRRGKWRPTSSWEPILMLAKTSRYYCDGEAVKTEAAIATRERNRYTRVVDDPQEQYAVAHDHEFEGQTANLRDVWDIAAEPMRAGWCPYCGKHFGDVTRLKGRRCDDCDVRVKKHYASFPTELPRLCLRASVSERGYCPTCSAPWVRMVRPGQSIRGDRETVGGREDDFARPPGGRDEWEGSAPAETLGWRASCQCPPTEPRPGRVLDPFSGSGRTGMACLDLGLDYVGVELNPDYAELSRRLLRQDAGIFEGV